MTTKRSKKLETKQLPSVELIGYFELNWEYAEQLPAQQPAVFSEMTHWTKSDLRKQCLFEQKAAAQTPTTLRIQQEQRNPQSQT